MKTACGCEVGDGAAGQEMDGSAFAAEAGQEETGPTASAGNPLCEARVGSRARILDVAVPGLPALEQRLIDLGFVPGSIVEVLRRAPMGDPVVYRVSDYELCLRRAQSACIRTEPVVVETIAS